MDWDSASVAKGYNSSCPSGKVSIPVTELIQGWSSYTAMVLLGADENGSVFLIISGHSAREIISTGT